MINFGDSSIGTDLGLGQHATSSPSTDSCMVVWRLAATGDLFASLAACKGNEHERHRISLASYEESESRLRRLLPFCFHWMPRIEQLETFASHQQTCHASILRPPHRSAAWLPQAAFLVSTSRGNCVLRHPVDLTLDRPGCAFRLFSDTSPPGCSPPGCTRPRAVLHKAINLKCFEAMSNLLRAPRT